MNEQFSWGGVASEKGVRLAVLAVGVMLVLFLLAKTVQEVRAWGTMIPGANYVTVEGEGRVTAIPNIASVSFSVSEEKATVAEAQKVATEKTDAALKAVKDLGIEDKDVKTASYQVYPQYEYETCYPGTYCGSSSRIRGYQVSQTITVKIRDTEKVGAVLGALGDAGVSNLSGPSFEIDDMETLKAEARAKAIAAAKEKAKTLSKDLGVSLGGVSSFWEQTDPGYPMPYYGMGGEMAMSAKADAAPSIPVGENEIIIKVSVTYQIH